MPITRQPLTGTVTTQPYGNQQQYAGPTLNTGNTGQMSTDSAQWLTQTLYPDQWEQQMARLNQMTPEQLNSPQWQQFTQLTPGQRAQLGSATPAQLQALAGGAVQPTTATQNPTQTAGVPPTGLIGAEMALRQGLSGAGAAIDAGVQNATNTLSPYITGGSGAFDYQAALSGALGQEAQQAAYDRFLQSPGTQYLMDQGEQAILRNKAATGGLGGGNVLRELQQHGIGLAAQDFNNAFNRLGSLSQLGYGASSNIAGLQGQAGMLGGEMAYGTGQQMAGYRNRAGERIADNINSTASVIADLINQQGQGMASQGNTVGTNLANFFMQYGRDMGLSSQQLMTLLANISQGAGSQVAGLGGIPGVGQNTGVLGSVGDFLSGLGSATRKK